MKIRVESSTFLIYPKNSSPLQPSSSQSSKSCLLPRMQSVPLQPLHPPRNLPLLSLTWRLSTPFMGGVMMFQSVSESKLLDQLSFTVSEE